ncbi:DUF92 domain-containing protein [Falsibacillus pallidus]|uniref:DUF92 domain-containing protein n=1 Tax=Falsibacillus pallidus TaxID=493781 RepID=UPI001FE62A87|nr:DUF92 domain-containing protein [Falsibacillus pallidus]
MIEVILLSIFIFIICTAGIKTKSLSYSGGAAAFICGEIIAVSFGLRGLLILGAFFLSSSLLSRFKASEKSQVEEIAAKGSRRDWQQVAANGGPAAIFCMANIAEPQEVWLICFCACLAAANADTWASELGVLSRGKPYSIRSFRFVQKGTSGAVSMLGTLAALAGAAFIAVISLVLFWGIGAYALIWITLSGFLGSVADTVFGAFLQVEYQCRKCKLKTEKTIHCSRTTQKVKGWKFVTNETVNFISPLLAGLLILFIYF